MGKQDAFWSGVPRNSSGDLDWPDGINERLELAADIVGARIIGLVNRRIENAIAGEAGEAGAHGDVFC